MWGLVMVNVYQHGNWLGYKNGGQWVSGIYEICTWMETEKDKVRAFYDLTLWFMSNGRRVLCDVLPSILCACLPTPWH